MTATIDILTDCSADGLPNQLQCELWINTALALHAKKTGNLQPKESVSIRFVDEIESRKLNKKYRGKDSASNVLSFSANFPAEIAEQLQILPLGDIVVCPLVVQRESTEQGKEPQSHWAHMIIHGLFHLLAYDHQSPEEARQMENMEISVLESLGIPNPYLIG